MIVVVRYNILKIFTMHFSKINQTYFILYYSFINKGERILLFTLKKSSKYNIAPRQLYFHGKF